MWGCAVCFLAVCIHAADMRLPFRRSGGGCVPSGREGHGAAGGSGVRRGSDHPLCCHLLLPHPGHSLKRDPGRDEGRTRGQNGASQRPQAGSSWCLWKERRHQKAVEPQGWMQEKVPALLMPQSHCNAEETQFRWAVFVPESSTWRRRRHPQFVDLKAMLWVFTESRHLNVPTAFSGTSWRLCGY